VQGLLLYAFILLGAALLKLNEFGSGERGGYNGLLIVVSQQPVYVLVTYLTEERVSSSNRRHFQKMASENVINRSDTLRF
jgi:hypothetical protein